MNPVLEAFLRAADLDDAGQLAGRLTALQPEDLARLRDVLTAWNDEQALANLLMHPHLLPDDLQPAALRRALDLDRPAYLVLAACVGLGKLVDCPFDSIERQAVGRQLLALAEGPDRLLADRASAAFRLFLQPDDLPRLLSLLEAPDPVLRHNGLVAVLRLAPPGAAQATLEAARRSGRLSQGAFVEVQNQLAAVDLSSTDLRDYRLTLLAAGLGTPLLAYIPNRADYDTGHRPETAANLPG